MNILNMDLDFFLNARLTKRPDTERPNEEGLKPWAEHEVEEFLENVLQLRHKVPGRVVTHHHEVFYHWRALIKESKLTHPFFICHVDAHSDFGLGFTDWRYLHGKFMELPLSERAFPTEGDEGLNYGSYMGYALGNRWFSEIDFVVPKTWNEDLSHFLITSGLPTPPEWRFWPGQTIQLELRHVTETDLAEMRLGERFERVCKSVGEPTVPMHIVAAETVGHRYNGLEWDFVYLAQSPGYTPVSADVLIPIFQELIEEM